jgi:hypothetical protein
MTRPVSLTVRVRIGDDHGPAVRVRGREAWALLALSFNIETIHEPHQGAFPGSHARYVLRSRVTRVEDRGVAA